MYIQVVSRKERPGKEIAPPNHFGAIVRAGRQLAGLDLQQAGLRSGFASGDYLNLIERGRRRPDLNHVPMIAKAVKLDPTWLCLVWLRTFAEKAYAAIRPVFSGGDHPAVAALAALEKGAELLCRPEDDRYSE